MGKPLEAAAVKEQASGRWESILASLAPDLSPALQRVGKHVDCPFHGGKDDFRVFKDVSESGGAICSCGEWSDGLALLQHARSWTFREALEAVADYLGIDSTSNAQSYRDTKEHERLAAQRERERQAKLKEEDEKKVRSLNNTWMKTIPLNEVEAEPVRLYFARRGLRTKHLPASLRCHTDLGYYVEGKNSGNWPSLVAKAVNLRNEPITLHRIYLTDEGEKASVPGKVKKMMPIPSTRSLAGGAIRLAEPQDILAITEGIETGLAVQHSTGIPTWVTINATMMPKVEIPPHVKIVAIYADKDESNAGQKAAKKLADRLRKQGVRVVVLVPQGDLDGQKSIDWNDILIRYGAKAIPGEGKVRFYAKQGATPAQKSEEIISATR